LTQAFGLWDASLLTPSRVSAILSPEHDYLWFNFFALHEAIELWRKGDYESNRTYFIDAVEHANPKGLLVAVVQLPRPNVNTSFPFSMNHPQQLGGIAHILHYLWCAGASWVLYSGDNQDGKVLTFTGGEPVVEPVHGIVCDIKANPLLAGTTLAVWIPAEETTDTATKMWLVSQSDTGGISAWLRAVQGAGFQ
jgi:hypothetical protein